MCGFMNNNCSQWHRHLGIYGLTINEEKQILVIKKITGPYKNRYDLPGGTLNQNESMMDSLKREFIEETGFTAIVKKCCGVHDFLLNTPYNNCMFTHHIAIFYFVELLPESISIKADIQLNCGNTEQNDSVGIEWVNLKDIGINNSSPLVIRAKEILETGIFEYTMSEYLNWHVL